MLVKWSGWCQVVVKVLLNLITLTQHKDTMNVTKIHQLPVLPCHLRSAHTSIVCVILQSELWESSGFVSLMKLETERVFYSQFADSHILWDRGTSVFKGHHTQISASYTISRCILWPNTNTHTHRMTGFIAVELVVSGRLLSAPLVYRIPEKLFLLFSFCSHCPQLPRPQKGISFRGICLARAVWTGHLSRSTNMRRVMQMRRGKYVRLKVYMMKVIPEVCVILYTDVQMCLMLCVGRFCELCVFALGCCVCEINGSTCLDLLPCVFLLRRTHTFNLSKWEHITVHYYIYIKKY